MNSVLAPTDLLGGEAIARRIRERLGENGALASIPGIVISGRDALANRPRAISGGAKAFLQKPVDNVELLAVIRHVLEHREEGAPPSTST